jgi:hypothetical protein
MQSIIDNFVLGGTPMAKDRLYAAPKMGGLGLLNVENMIKSAQCLWLSRIEIGGYIDSWRVSIMLQHSFNPLCFRYSPDNRTEHSGTFFTPELA